jgi:hypothetical protein
LIPQAGFSAIPTHLLRGAHIVMVARVNTVAFQGMDVIDIDVQVQMASGLPAFTKVELH